MTTSRAPQTIVLIGMMGSGKTTVGRALAVRTGWPYMDNDELVRRVTGREPAEIDATDGEAVLHEGEAQTLRHALTIPPPLIVGAAAWIVTHPSSVVLLRGQASVVYLRARPETLRARIGAGSGRREDATDLEWLRAKTVERDHIYREMAAVVIDTDASDPDTIAARLLAELGID
jgi:shikimate kinase/3-dehydroquinate synthase